MKGQFVKRSLNFDPFSLARLLDLQEILVGHQLLADRPYWSADVTAAVQAHADGISAALDGIAPSEVTHDLLKGLDPRDMWTIWSFLPCPWCGRSDSHDNLRALTSTEFSDQGGHVHQLVLACPLRASEANFEAALTQWQIARRNQLHGTYYPPETNAMQFAPYHNMGHHRDAIDPGVGGFDALFPAPEQQYNLYLGGDQGRLNSRATELLAAELVSEAVEGLLEAVREELGNKVELPQLP